MSTDGSVDTPAVKWPLVEIAGLNIGFRHANGGAPLVRDVDLTQHAVWQVTTRWSARHAF
jgi:peptide/nickel transport system ATP-binding protein